jgi:hypothetical protein
MRDAAGFASWLGARTADLSARWDLPVALADVSGPGQG